MKRFFAALLALLVVTASQAPAEYILIVANLGGQKGVAPPMGGGNIGTPTGNITGGARGDMRGGGGGVFGGPTGGGGGDNRGGGGGPIGTPPPPGGEGGPAFDPEAEPIYVYAVVEVNIPPAELDKYNKGGWIRLGHRWGGSAVAKEVPGLYTKSELVTLAPPGGREQPVPTVAKRYDDIYKQVHVKKPTTEQLLELAQWALAHGLVGRYAEVMDKLAADEKNAEPAVENYRKVKAELAKAATVNDAAPVLGSKLLEGTKRRESDHYVLVHNLADAAPEVKARLDLLENNFKAFFYWHALKGVVLPVPAEKQLAFLGDMKKEEFHQYHKTLASTPVVADGFYTRRENLVVFSKERLDEQYQTLSEKTQLDFWGKEFQRDKLLQGKQGVGYPPSATEPDYVGASMAALLLKTMEADAERAAVTHDATRQLLYATGLLHKNVQTPEWAQFGLASFFETPQGSPWMTVGTPHVEYLLLWRELRATHRLAFTAAADGKKTHDPAATLRKVVTDAYFREHAAVAAKADDKEVKLAPERKARATAWALAYFLMQTKLEGVQRYHKELAKMPRDMELSEAMLLECFARAFDCVDARNKVDDRKLDALAKNWDQFLERTPMELEPFFVKMRAMMRSYAATPPGTTPAPVNPGGRP